MGEVFDRLTWVVAEWAFRNNIKVEAVIVFGPAASRDWLVEEPPPDIDVAVFVRGRTEGRVGRVGRGARVPSTGSIGYRRVQPLPVRGCGDER